MLAYVWDDKPLGAVTTVGRQQAAQLEDCREEVALGGVAPVDHIHAVDSINRPPCHQVIDASPLTSPAAWTTVVVNHEPTRAVGRRVESRKLDVPIVVPSA